MADQAWPTPDLPAAGSICRRLFIPNGIGWLANVSGALLPLTYESNFFQSGTATPAQAAALYFAMYDAYSQDKSAECAVIGQIVPFAGSVSPSVNLLLCDGASYLRAAQPQLFGVIGTTYGFVDAVHFNVPDLRGRTIIGVGTGPGLSPRALAATSGEEKHTLTSPEMPAHTHSYLAPTPPTPTALVGIFPSVNSEIAALTGSAGGGAAHNNMQPWIGLNYLIVAQ